MRSRPQVVPSRLPAHRRTGPGTTLLVDHSLGLVHDLGCGLADRCPQGPPEPWRETMRHRRRGRPQARGQSAPFATRVNRIRTASEIVSPTFDSRFAASVFEPVVDADMEHGGAKAMEAILL